MKIIKVKECLFCPFVDERVFKIKRGGAWDLKVTLRRSLTKTADDDGKIIEEISSTPHWCPLPDAEGGVEVNYEE